MFEIQKVYQANVWNHHPQHGQHPQAAMRKYQCKMCPQVNNPQRTINWLKLAGSVIYFWVCMKNMILFCFSFVLEMNFVPFVSARNANILVKNVATTHQRQSLLMSLPHALWENNWFGLIFKWMANTFLIIYRSAHLMVTCVTCTLTGKKKKC